MNIFYYICLCSRDLGNYTHKIKTNSNAHKMVFLKTAECVGCITYKYLNKEKNSNSNNLNI